MRRCCDGSFTQIMEERSRMWIFMIFLCILGLNSCQAAGQENSTQIYYTVLTVEKSAMENITNILKVFKVTDNKLQVDNFEMTTSCKILQDHVECSCEKDHSWSSQVCESQSQCCGNNTKCSFPKASLQTCYPNTKVTMTGSFTLIGDKFYGCLEDKTVYKQCHDEILREMKIVYSTFNGFDSLKIVRFEFRRGSVIVHFEVNVNKKVAAQALTNKTVSLSNKLNGNFSLATTGLIVIKVPKGPVCDKRNVITCTPKEDLKLELAWQLTRTGQVFDITNGTESELTSTGAKATILLNTTSEMWAGVFTCIYSQKLDLGTIVHKASAKLDVALLPQIHIVSDPEFPHCKDDVRVKVKVICEIKKSSENYIVTWHDEGTKSEIQSLQVVEDTSDTIIYAAETTVGCNGEKTPNVTCKFTNRCSKPANQKNATIQINVIHGNGNFCKGEGDWADTKAGYSAVLKCYGKAGNRIRRCSKDGEWEDEESFCVNQDLNSILENTTVVDIGLGTVDENAAVIFSRLTTATNNTQRINTYANVNASVNILFSMKTKLRQIANESILDDLLHSSSNILDESLENSWTKVDKESNFSLAERYLNSVEDLIRVTNIAGLTKETSNIQVGTCSRTQGSHCKNTVFNVTVSVADSNSGSVKTTGFKHLEKYLPQTQKDYKPNSLVVSTTTETAEKSRSQSPVVSIDFQLLKPRLPNHNIECVSWDETNSIWSSKGCTWSGPYNEGHCECVHLSTFALLMSGTPLDIAWKSELTYTGLAVSIISLILCLGMEFAVWSYVANTNTLRLRHTAHVNIFLCLLIADCSFIASDFARNVSEAWCQIFVVLKHFCYLSMFFWMLCLNIMLLHQIVLVFEDMNKTKSLVVSFLLGYMCPFLIVAITFITNDSGAKGSYYSYDTCWLSYFGFMEGSIFTFIIPIGVIVFVNVFTIVMVIMKLLERPKDSANHLQNEKKAVKSVLRTVVILTPIFGVTWILGFAVMAVDLTYGVLAIIVNYAFILLNAFQGFFILLTTCLGDKMMRDALLKRTTKRRPIASESVVSSTVSTDSMKKK